MCPRMDNYLSTSDIYFSVSVGSWILLGVVVLRLKHRHMDISKDN